MQDEPSPAREITSLAPLRHIQKGEEIVGLLMWMGSHNILRKPGLVALEHVGSILPVGVALDGASVLSRVTRSQEATVCKVDSST